MNVSQVVPWITGAGGAIVVLAAGIWAFYAGKLHSDSEFRKVVTERDEYRAAHEIDQQTIKELAGTGSVTNQLIGALTTMAQRGQDEARRVRDVTPEDLGLR